MHAAIDIGTNSFHLVVARAKADGGFEVVTTEKEMVRLGSGGRDMKRLAPEAIERGLEALGRMVKVAASYGAEVSAVATSAVREAENRDEFVGRARRELGVEVEVISGFEEARLIHHGVIHAIPVSGKRILVVDIGGGSTEFIAGESDDIIDARSLRLGAIRLTERYFRPNGSDKPPSTKAIARCRDYLRDSLHGVARELGAHEHELAIGSSGTITSVASMIAAVDGPVPRVLNGFTFTANQLRHISDLIIGSTPSERAKIRALDAKRVDIIVGGVLLLDEIFSAFDLGTMTVSEQAVREGVLYDRFPAGLDHRRDLRRSNAIRLARQLDLDAGHAETSARLATELFDQTRDLHGLDDDARTLLDVAGIVHNVGLFISHSGHHKHTYYIVRNTEHLTGFTEHEIELIAQIARYHRKSHPSAKHESFAALSADDQAAVAVLAGLLRVAIGLDRRHSGVVSGLDVALTKGSDRVDLADVKKRDRRDLLLIQPTVPRGCDIGLEVFAATERRALLAEALGIDVVIRAEESES